MQPSRGERTTRSRYNSPKPPAPNNAPAEDSRNSVESTAEGSKKEGWTEPPLPPPRPSFADHGIERHGVVANMAPLGTRPSMKVWKAATKPESLDMGGRLAFGRRTGASNTPFEAMTPEPPASIPERPASVSSKATDLDPPSPKTPQQLSPQRNVPKPTVETQSFSQNSFTLSQSPSQTITPTLPIEISETTTPIASTLNTALPMMPAATSTPTTPSFALQPPLQLGADGLPLIDLDKTEKVVEHAVQWAIDNRRYPTAYALRFLYDEAVTDATKVDEHVVRLIEAIYCSRATFAQISEFKALLKPKKREGRKDKTGEYYFNGDGSDPAPTRYHSISTVLSYGARPGTGGRSPIDAQPRPSPFAHLSASPLKEYDIAHIAKKQKTGQFVSPYPPLPPMSGLNGAFGAAFGSAGTNGAAHAKPETPQQNGTSSESLPRTTRSESLSSLSSVDTKMLDSEFSSPAKSRATGRSRQKEREKDRERERESEGEGEGEGERSDNSSAGYPASASVSAETLAAQSPSTQPQPISAPQKNGPKTYTFLPTPSSSSSINHHPDSHHPKNSSSTAAANADMAPIALADTAPAPANPPKFIFHKVKSLDKVRGRAHDDDETTNRLKRSAREITNSKSKAKESFERHQPPPPPPPPADVDTTSEGDLVDAPSPKRPTKIRLLNNGRTARPRSNYDSDLSSPTALSFQPDIAPGSVSASRAGTPSAVNRPTRKAKSGSGLRVKTSPMKKKGGGPLAGIPRASGERSPIGNGAAPTNPDDNDDYCSACGGNGDLVCCDGCIRSYHFKCVDPPMVEGALPDSWYCNLCDSKLNPSERESPPRTCFEHLLDRLEARNPMAFHLPKEIREYFEGVKTGAEGEYEEIVPPKPKNPKGYEEAPDLTRLKDGKGKAILCHACNKAASAPDRLIIPCSYCNLHWHLDCVDNPLTKEPHSSKKWRCPAHIDDIMDILPTNLGPAHRYRKIKGNTPVTPAWRRGTKNNGHIEVEDLDSEPIGGGFYDDNKFGVVYRLPEEGIKLDFISKIKQSGGGIEQARLRQRFEAEQQAARFETRPIVEQQAGLNLLALAEQNLGGSVDLLVDALLTEASPAVVALIARGDASSLSQKKPKQKLSKGDKQCLKTIMAAIQRQLDESDNLMDTDHGSGSRSVPIPELKEEQPRGVVTPPREPENDTTARFDTPNEAVEGEMSRTSDEDGDEMLV